MLRYGATIREGGISFQKQVLDSDVVAVASSSASVPSNIDISSSSALEKEEEEFDEMDYDEGDGFLGSEGSVTPLCSTALSFISAVFQQVLCTTFNVDVKAFFKIFFSDESTFTKYYHEQRGDKGKCIS